MCFKGVVRHDYESVTCGSTCPRCIGVKMVRGAARVGRSVVCGLIRLQRIYNF